MRTTGSDDLQEQDEEQDTIAIRQCLEYLVMESERLGLFETARYISVAVDSMEDSVVADRSAMPPSKLHS